MDAAGETQSDHGGETSRSLMGWTMDTDIKRQAQTPKVIGEHHLWLYPSSATSPTSICRSAHPSYSLEVKAMRSFLAGCSVVGMLAMGTVAPATAHPLAVPPAGQSLAIQQADWNGGGCGPRCWEHRREAREREHQRWVQHRHWEEHQRREESRYAPAYGYQHRYGG